MTKHLASREEYLEYFINIIRSSYSPDAIVWRDPHGDLLWTATRGFPSKMGAAKWVAVAKKDQDGQILQFDPGISMDVARTLGWVE